MRSPRGFRPHTRRKERAHVTVCVAALCEDSKTIVMVADKMIGFGYAESEPDIDKMRSLHKDWWILFAADDVSPVFEIIDFAKTHIGSKGKNPGDPASLRDVMEAVEVGFERKRVGDAANLYLPTGWSLKDFN